MPKYDLFGETILAFIHPKIVSGRGSAPDPLEAHDAHPDQLLGCRRWVVVSKLDLRCNLDVGGKLVARTIRRPDQYKT